MLPEELPSEDDAVDSEVEVAKLEEKHPNLMKAPETSAVNIDQGLVSEKSSGAKAPEVQPDSSNKQWSGNSNSKVNSEREISFGHSLADRATSLYISKIKMNSFRSAVLICLGVGIIMYVSWVLINTWLVKHHSQSHHAARAHIASLPVCRARMIEELLPASVGYDCVLSKPRSSREPVRLEGCIEMLADGFPLVSPLQQDECIKFSSAVYCQEKDAMRPHPIAVYSTSVPFVVALNDAPEVKVLVQGEDVCAFDMQSGYHSSKQTFISADQHWKEFVLDCHVGASQPIHGLQGSEELLEFRESAIRLGSVVTLFGELHRDSTGNLHLQPWSPQNDAIPELHLASGKHTECKENSGLFGKVLLSDDQSLQTSVSIRCLRFLVSSISKYFVRKGPSDSKTSETDKQNNDVVSNSESATYLPM
jgi:hypothetical protein